MTVVRLEVPTHTPGHTMFLLRWIHGLDFLGGIAFASFAWILILLGFGAFVPGPHWSMRDSVLAISGAVLSATGYCVWAGWFNVAANGRYFFGNPQAFYALAYVHHVGWLFFFPYLRGTNIFEFASNATLPFLWIACHIVEAMIGFAVVESPQSSAVA